MKEWKYFAVSGGFLLLVSVGKVLDKWRKKEITKKIGIASSFVFSIIGGLLAGMLANVYIEKEQIQWIVIAGGAWMGEKLLETVADAINEKINLIFKTKKK